MNNQNRQLNSHTGFSLIETVVAIAILLVVISGIMNLVYQGATSSQSQQERITATYLASEAIEFIRADRDSYWLDDIGSNTFDGWLSKNNITACQSADGCRIDARVGGQEIADCSGDCPVLEYNRNSKVYGYESGIVWTSSRYRRTVEIESLDHNNDGNDDEAIITATVTWQRSGGDMSSIILQESLTGWWR